MNDWIILLLIIILMTVFGCYAGYIKGYDDANRDYQESVCTVLSVSSDIPNCQYIEKYAMIARIGKLATRR